MIQIHKNYTCNNGYAILRKVTWTVAFLGAFQPSTITLNEKKSIITLSAGAGSAFGLLNTTMLIWTLLFPVVSKKNPLKAEEGFIHALVSTVANSFRKWF